MNRFILVLSTSSVCQRESETFPGVIMLHILRQYICFLPSRCRGSVKLFKILSGVMRVKDDEVFFILLSSNSRVTLCLAETKRERDGICVQN